MKRIFSGEVYDMIPQPNGLIFSYCKSSSDNKVAVFYKMFSYELETVDDVTSAIYLMSKYGSNFHAASELTNNYVTAKSVVLPNGRVFVCSENGDASLLDGNDEVVWRGELKYRDTPPSDIAVFGNSLWTCFSDKNVLIRFNMATMREELRLGGKVSPFDRPFSIYQDGDCAVVSNIGSKKLIRVDLKNYTTEDMYEFTEAVYGYARYKEFEYVLLESGIYKI